MSKLQTEIKFTLEDSDFDPAHIRPATCRSCIFGHALNRLPEARADEGYHFSVGAQDGVLRIREDDFEEMDNWVLGPAKKAETIIEELDKFATTWYRNADKPWYQHPKLDKAVPTEQFIEHLEKMKKKYSGKNFKLKFKEKLYS